MLGAFFSRDLKHIFSVSRDGGVFVWTPVPHGAKRAREDDDEEPSDEPTKRRPAGVFANVTWTLSQRHFVNQPFSKVTSVDFHVPSGVLAVGLSTGLFCLYELPDFAAVHTLSISQQAVSSVSFNADGQWLALGVRGAGQLIVWEWQSESYVFRQQGHLSSPPTCLAYTTDGAHVATGGADAKIKLWSTRDASAVVTWTEHSAEVTDLAFAKGGQVLFSCSLDGTVRAFDLVRYRNFRTFVAPSSVQFNCIAVDQSGEIVCAGSRDTYDVYVWNVQNGRLLDVLSGHQGPIVSIVFSPSEPSVIATGSWDKTCVFCCGFFGLVFDLFFFISPFTNPFPSVFASGMCLAAFVRAMFSRTLPTFSALRTAPTASSLPSPRSTAPSRCGTRARARRRALLRAARTFLAAAVPPTV